MITGPDPSFLSNYILLLVCRSLAYIFCFVNSCNFGVVSGKEVSSVAFSSAFLATLLCTSLSTFLLVDFFYFFLILIASLKKNAHFFRFLRDAASFPLLVFSFQRIIGH